MKAVPYGVSWPEGFFYKKPSDLWADLKKMW